VFAGLLVGAMLPFWFSAMTYHLRFFFCCCCCCCCCRCLPACWLVLCFPSGSVP
jgi:hypothetical protein